MNKVKKVCLLTAAVVVALSVVLYASGIRVDIWFGDKECFSAVVMGCDPPCAYEQRDGVGYLTVPYKNFDGFLTMTVEDEALQKELAGADLSEIIGMSFHLYVSGDAAKQLGLSQKNFDAFSFMGGSAANSPGSKLVLNEVYYY